MTLRDEINFVYRMVDPRDSVPFYVGITNNPNLRHRQHLSARDNNLKKIAKIKQLDAEGVEARMEIIETVYSSRGETEERERYWIQYYLDQGIELTNIQYVDIVKSPPKEPKEPKRSLRVKPEPRGSISLQQMDAVLSDFYVKFATNPEWYLNSLSPETSLNYQDMSTEERAALFVRPAYTFLLRSTLSEERKVE